MKLADLALVTIVCILAAPVFLVFGCFMAVYFTGMAIYGMFNNWKYGRIN